MGATLDTSVLARADGNALQANLAVIKGRRPTGWIGQTHPARRGELPFLWRDVLRIADRDLVDAVALSAPSHCIDGWSYASRGVSAILSGDMHAARHLAYYAQLRAALSFLANVGVGIFNGINFVVDDGGRVHRLDPDPVAPSSQRGLGTHKVVWQALEGWANNSSQSKHLLEVLRLAGTSYRDCLDGIWPGSANAAVVVPLIASWGVDLRRAGADHDFRNVSSYVSHALNPLPQQVLGNLNFVANFWELHEPTGSGGFDKLDRFLLRSILQAQHFRMYSNKSYGTGSISNRFDQLPATVRSVASREFLISNVEKADPLLLTKARLRTSPAGPLEMMARAFLLLRTATALTHHSLAAAGVSSALGDLRPWLDTVATDRGFRDPNKPYTDILELWYEVQYALEDLRSSKKPAPSSLADWIKRPNRGMPILTEVERIGVWSFGV